MKARLKASYDAIADKYNAHFTSSDDPVRLKYLQVLLSQLQTDDQQRATVLELGCGAGVPATRRLLEIASPVIHVTGNDLSTSQLDLARKNLADFEDRLTLVEGDMLALKFPDQTFNAVTGFYSIIHLPREEQTQLLRRIAAWLKPDGLLLANFAVEESKVVVQEKWLGEDKGWMHWSSWGEQGSAKMIEDAGLKIIFTETKQVGGDANFVWLLAKKTGF
ncbi:methyltransferase [Boeremia exigua]|uniref:methyltransferase n=1 Tax=Boeremia exigua TaxID=749465 RepID=UPI001E8E5B07|nr:methyltransferase [Boeremia exigua]KAH6642830.1 methyltransferase [Boeremia exigua]